MLFEIRPNLEQSKVFDGLNLLLVETLLAALESRPVDEAHLPAGLCAAIAGNQPTRAAVDALSAKLSALDQGQKQALKAALAVRTDPCAFLSNRTAPLTAIPEAVFPACRQGRKRIYSIGFLFFSDVVHGSDPYFIIFRRSSSAIAEGRPSRYPAT